jgi:hypothetical protein
MDLGLKYISSHSLVARIRVFSQRPLPLVSPASTVRHRARLCRVREVQTPGPRSYQL